MPQLLKDMHQGMFERAKKRIYECQVQIRTWNDFMNALQAKKFALCPWCGDMKCEEAIKLRCVIDSKKRAEKDPTLLTGACKSLCIPFKQPAVPVDAICFACGKKAITWTLFGRSY